MSDNNIQSIKNKLSRQTNALTQREIEYIGHCIEKSDDEKIKEFELVLTGELYTKLDQKKSLAGKMMFWVGDENLATKVVYGSGTTPSRSKINEAEFEDLRRTISQWTAIDNWSRYCKLDSIDTFDSNPEDSDPCLDENSGGNNEYTPQNVTSGNRKFKSDFDLEKENMLQDLKFD